MGHPTSWKCRYHLSHHLARIGNRPGTASKNSYYDKIFWNYALQMSAYATSSLKLRFGTRDTASGNLKYCAVDRSELQALGIWSDYTECLNHKCMLGFLACMFAVFATEFLHAVNSLTIFLNCHTHRLRMVIPIEQYLKAEGRVVLLPGRPPAIDVAYAKECISYFSRWGSVAAGRFNNSKRDSSKAKKTAAWCEK